jgi:hypothetical protein
MKIKTSKSVKKCCVCGRPVFSPKSNHCFGCHQIALHMAKNNIHGKVAEEIWEHVRRWGHVCFYTKLRLDMTNPRSPFYFVFDHMVPGDGRKIVLTFALLNEMKSDMIPQEFWYYILQLDECFKTGKKIRKIKLSRWYRLTPPLPPALPLPSKSFQTGSKKCWLCGKRPVYAPRARYCLRCYKFVYSMANRRINYGAAKKILKYVHGHGFVCEYTQTPLNMTDYKDPFYYEFDHTIPGDKREVALTFSLLNEMKSAMTFKEFKYYIGQFANFLRTGAPIKKRKLAHWSKLSLKYAM